MSLLPTTFVKGFHDEETVRKMKYKSLGNTGLEISIVSQGCGGFSSFYGQIEENEAIETVREAIRKGVNYIDTAPYYGQGRSETILGKALKGIPREAYYVATKVGRYEMDFDNMFDFSRKKTIESVNKSLALLGLDYIDVIQVHDCEFPETISTIINETLPALEELKKEGKVRFIGVTGYPVSVLKNVIENSKVHIDTVLSYSRNTLIDSTLSDYIPFFQSKNMGIICAAAHGLGLLTNAGPQPWHPAPDDLKNKIREVSEYCKTKNVELGRLAMWKTLTEERVTTHLTGMMDRKTLDKNLDIFYNGLSNAESQVLADITEKFLKHLPKNVNWEGIEIQRYREYMKSAGKM